MRRRKRKSGDCVPDMRVVIDTNVIISGVFFGGMPRAVLERAEAGEIIPCFTITTFEELQEILGRNKFASARAALSFSTAEFLTTFREHSLFFPKIANSIHAIKEDSSDNAFLACALAASAAFIVSGDKHLLKLRMFAAIPIVTPAQFLKQLRKKK